jgi:hypothetical protein
MTAKLEIPIHGTDRAECVQEGLPLGFKRRDAGDGSGLRDHPAVAPHPQRRKYPRSLRRLADASGETRVNRPLPVAVASCLAKYRKMHNLALLRMILRLGKFRS